MSQTGVAARTNGGAGGCDPRWIAPLLLVFAALASAAYAVRGLPTNDEAAVLTAASRLLRGDVFYRDIDAYWFPGAAQLLALAMRAFGEHFSVARWLAAGFFCVTVLALYAAALQVLDRRRAALFGLSLLAFKFIGWPAFTAYLYSDVAFAGAAGAIACFLGHAWRGPTWRLAAAGACTGVAVVTKQNLGIYLAGTLGVLIVLPELLLGVKRERSSDRWRELAALVAGIAVPTALLVGYALAHGVLGAMIESGLVRPFTGYAPSSSLPFSAPLQWWEFGILYDTIVYAIGPFYSMLTWEALPAGPVWRYLNEIFVRILYTSVPLAFLWALFQAWLDRRGGRPSAMEARRAALALLAFACFLSALPRADLFHIASIYPVVWLLIFSHVSADHERDPEAAARAPWRSATAVSLLLLATGLLGAFYLSLFDHRIRLERMDRDVSPRLAWVESIARYVEDEVPPDEPLFVYGHEAVFYFLTGRFPPWPFSQLYPGQAGFDYGERLAGILAREKPRVVILGNPAWPGLIPLAVYTPRIGEHLREHYTPTVEHFERYPITLRGSPLPVLKRNPVEQP